MSDDDFKKKLTKTLAQYDEKFQTQSHEITALKSALVHLCDVPLGLDEALDSSLKVLKSSLQSEVDPELFSQRLNLLTASTQTFQLKKKEHSTMIHHFVTEQLQLLSPYLRDPLGKSLIETMKLTLKDKDDKLLLMRFSALLKQCMGGAESHEDSASFKNSVDSALVSKEVNKSLGYLLDHLSVPNELAVEVVQLKSALSKELSSDALSQLIDTFTQLMTDAFNIEQGQVKSHLQELTNHLIDFEKHFRETSENHLETRQDSLQLEVGITDNILAIKEHMLESTSLNELSQNISKNLTSITDKVTKYKETEHERFSAYEKQVLALQAKLKESEEGAEEIKNMLSIQKSKINQDTLTALPNRAAYDERAIDAVHRWQRGFGDLTLAVADIDHFKKINDTYGHIVGDKVLRKIAELFKSSIRSVDFVARYGGEEFVFIFEKTALKEAKKILEKLRKDVENCELFYRDTQVSVTVSFGLTEMGSSDTLETLFVRADEAMYKAKHSGRNRVEVIGVT
jgi:diguanylate cyclase